MSETAVKPSPRVKANSPATSFNKVSVLDILCRIEHFTHCAASLAPELYVALSIKQIAYRELKTLNRSIRTTHISRKTRIKNQPPMKRESAMNDQEKLRCLWNIFETSDDEDERISASRMILSLSAAEDTYIDSPINEAA